MLFTIVFIQGGCNDMRRLGCGMPARKIFTPHRTLKVTDLFWENCDTKEFLRRSWRLTQIQFLSWNMEKIIGMATTVYDPWASFIWHVAIDPAYQNEDWAICLREEAEQRLRLRGTTSVNGYVLPTIETRFPFLKRAGMPSASPLWQWKSSK